MMMVFPSRVSTLLVALLVQGSVVSALRRTNGVGGGIRGKQNVIPLGQNQRRAAPMMGGKSTHKLPFHFL